MKPLRLTIDGITSFKSEQTVDFEQLGSSGIFCICGPTGSGKTTVLDCIILALYGSNKNRGNLTEYINTGCDKGKITLDFVSDGVIYRVYRELRRSGVSIAKLINSDTGEVIADKTDAVNEAVKGMLKLGAKDFTKVVILEQGKFSEFMKMTEKERFETISHLFSLERFDKLKKTVAEACKRYQRQDGELAAALNQYADVTQALIDDLKKQLSEVKKQDKADAKVLAQTEAELNKLKDLYKVAEQKIKCEQDMVAAENELRELSEKKEKLQAELAKLERDKEELKKIKKESDEARVILGKIDECKKDTEEITKLKPQLDKLLCKHGQLKKKKQELTEQSEELTAEQTNAQKKIDELYAEISECGYTPESKDEAAFTAVSVRAERDNSDRAQTEIKLKKVQEEVDKLKILAEKLLADGNRLKAELAKQQAEYEQNLNNYEQARLSGAAAVVRSSISSGDICPVCGGVYHGEHAPSSDDDELIARLKEECAKCESAVKQTQEKAGANEREFARYTEALSTAEENLGEQQNKLNGLPANSAKAAAAAKQAAQCAKKLAATELKLQELNSDLKAVNRDIELTVDEGTRLRNEETKLKTKIAERLGGATPEAASEAATEAIERCEKAQAQADEQEKRLNTLSAQYASDEAVAKSKRQTAQSALETLPAATVTQQDIIAKTVEAEKIKGAISVNTSQIGRLNAKIEDATNRLAIKKELAAQKKSIAATLDNLLKLNTCVSGENKLLAYVAEEYIKAFTAAASETLYSLTNGKYTLVYEDGGFFVLDFFADNAKRNVQTLSGGETFLASISLAMAISQQLANQNYEFFFIDEGFGTLNEQMVETVASALISLSKQTTVGIVTHRNELADRIPVRLNVIAATETEGSKFELNL